MPAWKANRILTVNVAHNAILVVIRLVSTLCGFFLAVTIVNLIYLILYIVLVGLILPFFFVAII